jgi:hypothetical protein
VARWESLELWKKGADVKFEQFTESSRAQTAAIDELRSMLSSFLHKEGSERVMPKPNKNDHHITAMKADVTLPDSASGFEYGSKEESEGGEDLVAEVRALHLPGEEEHAGGEGSEGGECNGGDEPMPCGGCPSPSTLNEDANVVEPARERLPAVEAAPAAPSPSQKKSKKAGQSAVKVRTTSSTL